MVSPDKPASQSAKTGLRHGLDRVLALRPEWPLALALVLSGAVNIETGLRYNLVPFSKIGHYLYYPITRYYLGRSLGYRGVFPIQKSVKPHKVAH